MRAERPRSDSPTFEEVCETVGLLFQVMRKTQENFDQVAKDFGLTPAQAQALLELRDDVPMRGLADRLRCDASNITTIADRLEVRGLITRGIVKGDRRVKILTLTEEGKRVRTALEVAACRASPVMTALTSEERLVLRELMKKASDEQAS